MNETCDCCEGIEQLTPIAIANRPGLNALLYRVGTHASFLETMIARLSNFPLTILLNELDEQGKQKVDTIYPLQGLTARSADDPAIALLDAWATVADVLTFYQERIANEGYLRTATERRSILELARLVGYVLRPGVAASVFLAYTLEKDHDVVILPGNRAQSVPGPGELPQSFETAEKLEARFVWNTLQPRLTRPQLILPQSLTSSRTTTADGKGDGAIYFLGTSTNLKAGDPLLFVFDGNIGTNNVQGQAFIKIATVATQAAENRTKVLLQKPAPATIAIRRLMARATTVDEEEELGETKEMEQAEETNELEEREEGEREKAEDAFSKLVKTLSQPPSLQPSNTQRLVRNVTQTFSAQSDIHPQLLVNISPVLQPTLYSAIANAPSALSQPVKAVLALRVKAAPFGHNAPLKQDLKPDGHPDGPPKEWPLADNLIATVELSDSSAGGSGITAASSTPTFGGKVPVDYNISISRGGVEKAVRNVVQRELTNEIAQIDDLTIRINVTVDNPTQLIKEAVFEFLELNHVIHLIKEGNNWNVLIDGAALKVAPGQTLQPVLIKGGRAEIKFNQKLTISLSRLNVITLDAQYDKITQTSESSISWLVIERPDKAEPIISKVTKVETVSIAAYGITGKVTQLTLDQDWLLDNDKLLSVLRNITVYAQSEPREQAEEPIDGDIEATPNETDTVKIARLTASTGQIIKHGTDKIELDRLYDGLKSGQRLIVSGERTDVFSNGVPVTGVKASELVMLKSVTQDVQKIPKPESTDGSMIDLPGDKKHTFLQLAEKLAYTYKRDTVTIYANVVRATHGETRTEVLGSGDGSKALQQFTLRQSPLTYLAAPTPAGAESTLQVRVNDILWHEVDSLAGLGPKDRDYVTDTDDAGKTTGIFGNGQHGARLPTGVENVKAVYRTGIGKPGNVKAGQINLLSTKPLGVKAVINPLPAAGGADKESRDQARRNVPLALLALDRLVSVQDYADFARTFAGIGKASAVRLSDRRRQLVHLTIAGADNIPIDPNSDLYQNLFQALRQFGDTNQPLRVDIAEVMFLVISARLRLLPDYKIEAIEPKVRAALLDTFSFDRRELGQPVFQSEVLSVIQGIAGVDYVDLEVMTAVDENTVLTALDAAAQNTAEEPGEIEDLQESKEAEAAEELFEILGLDGHGDVPVKLAGFDPTATKTGGIAPAQLAFLSPDVPDTLILTELPK